MRPLATESAWPRRGCTLCGLLFRLALYSTMFVRDNSPRQNFQWTSGEAQDGWFTCGAGILPAICVLRENPNRRQDASATETVAFSRSQISTIAALRPPVFARFCLTLSLDITT